MPLKPETLVAAAEYGFANVVRDKAFAAYQTACNGNARPNLIEALQQAHEIACDHAKVARRAYLAAVEADPAV